MGWTRTVICVALVQDNAGSTGHIHFFFLAISGWGCINFLQKLGYRDFDQSRAGSIICIKIGSVQKPVLFAA
jgi:hypothetical protein